MPRRKYKDVHCTVDRSQMSPSTRVLLVIGSALWDVVHDIVVMGAGWHYHLTEAPEKTAPPKE